jgi:glycosyltransferase involved in cell wall biosynthesis
MGPRLEKTVVGAPSQRRRLAFVAFDFVDYCIPIANALAGRADVRLYLPESQTASVRRELDSAIDFVPFRKPRLRQPLPQLATCLRLVRSIRRYRPDVVHLQQGHFWFNFFLPLLRSYPLVLTVHDHRHHVGDRGSRKTPMRILNYGFSRADALVVHAASLGEEIVSGLGLSEEKIHVIRSLEMAGVSHRGENGDALGAVEDAARVVLFFGRIWPYKGLDYLIRAEPLISAEVPDVRIVIAGEGEDFSPYRRLMANPERFVVHNEFVSNQKRAELFSQASVVVLPYIEATQSGVVPVAYAFGKPVVSTAVGGLPEYVQDGETGVIVPPADEVALAEAIVRVLKDGELRRRLGSTARRMVRGECSAGTVADKTLAVYESVLCAVAEPMAKPEPAEA